VDLRSPEYIRRSIGRCPTTPEQCSRSTCDREHLSLMDILPNMGIMGLFHRSDPAKVGTGTIVETAIRSTVQQYRSCDILDRGHMYYAIVKRIALHNFLRVNRKDYAAILKSCSPDIHHRFGGHHALGGERHDREALARWFDRLWAGWHLRCNSQFTMYG
jgi:hypothetical protein